MTNADILRDRVAALDTLASVISNRIANMRIEQTRIQAFHASATGTTKILLSNLNAAYSNRIAAMTVEAKTLTATRDELRAIAARLERQALARVLAFGWGF